MNTIYSRRLFACIVIAILVAMPFVARFFRKSKQYAESAGPAIVSISPNEVPKGVTPSGRMSISEVVFQPLALPNKNLQWDSIVATVSADSELLFVAYSYDTDWKAKLCYADIRSDFFKPPFQELYDSPSQTKYTSLGCSKRMDKASYTLSFAVLGTEPAKNESEICPEALYRTTLKRVEQKIVFDDAQDHRFIRLMNAPNGPQITKKLFDTTSRGINTFHLWLANDDKLFFGGAWGINAYDSTSELNTKTQLASPLLYKFTESKDNQPGEIQKFLTSNIYEDSQGNLNFIEKKFPDGPIKQPSDVRAIPFNVGDGHLVTIDRAGKVIRKRDFPAIHHPDQRVLLTSTHWCFMDVQANQGIIIAPLDNPKEYILCRFPEDQLRDEGSQFYYFIRILALLPDGRHVLCSRNVLPRHRKEAIAKHLPLSELGIVELPFSLCKH